MQMKIKRLVDFIKIAKENYGMVVIQDAQENDAEIDPQHSVWIESYKCELVFNLNLRDVIIFYVSDTYKLVKFCCF